MLKSMKKNLINKIENITILCWMIKIFKNYFLFFKIKNHF